MRLDFSALHHEVHELIPDLRWLPVSSLPRHRIGTNTPRFQDFCRQVQFAKLDLNHAL
jgi:hypothetical protein